MPSFTKIPNIREFYGTNTLKSVDGVPNTPEQIVGLVPMREVQTLGDYNFPFTATFDTEQLADAPTSSGSGFLRIPQASGGTYNALVDWGDGSPLESITALDPSGYIEHDYNATTGGGIKTVKIFGTWDGLRYNNTASKDKLKLLTVERWGNEFYLGDYIGTFYGCANFTTINDSNWNEAARGRWDFQQCFMYCNFGANFPLLDFSTGTRFGGTWYSAGLTNLPLVDMSNATNLGISLGCWQNNNFGDNFPGLNFPKVTTARGAWRNAGLTSFPPTDFPLCNNFADTWKINNLGNNFGACTFPKGADFNRAWEQAGLTSFPNIAMPLAEVLQRTWRNNSLADFPAIDFPAGEVFVGAWAFNLLESFPLIDVSQGVNFGGINEGAWYNNDLTSFPLLDFSNATSLAWAWRDNSLTSFPLISTPLVQDFSLAWNVNNLTSFPAINTSSATNLDRAWAFNSLSTFPDINTPLVSNFRNMISQNPIDRDWRDLELDSVTDMSFIFQNTAHSQANYDLLIPYLLSEATTFNRLNVPFFTTAPYTMSQVESGTSSTTGATLTDGTKNFTTAGVVIGDVVVNTVTKLVARVTAVGTTTLTLDTAVAVNGDTYSVQQSQQAKDRAELILDFGWTITDGGGA